MAPACSRRRSLLYTVNTLNNHERYFRQLQHIEGLRKSLGYFNLDLCQCGMPFTCHSCGKCLYSPGWFDPHLCDWCGTTLDLHGVIELKGQWLHNQCSRDRREVTGIP